MSQPARKTKPLINYNSYDWAHFPGNAYRIFKGELMVCPQMKDGSYDYDDVSSVSADAFTEVELAEFTEELYIATGWIYLYHYNIIETPTKNQQP